MITSELSILYGFLAFISLLLVAALGFLARIALAVGRLQGQYNGLSEQMREMNANLTARIDRLEEQMGNLREQVANLREQVAEVRGMLLAVNRNIDLLMRHHHNDAGQVVIVPAEEVAAD